MSKKKHIGKNALSVIIFVFFLIYAISLLYPLVWAFLSSLKTSTEYMLTSKVALPETWEFGNYIKAFKALDIEGNNMFDMLFNSIWYTVGGVFLGMAYYGSICRCKI